MLTVLSLSLAGLGVYSFNSIIQGLNLGCVCCFLELGVNFGCVCCFIELGVKFLAAFFGQLVPVFLDYFLSADVCIFCIDQVVAFDFGIKHNILRRLSSYGCRITVVPSQWPASEVIKLNPDGVLFSNGPGDPSAVPYAVETVKEITGKIPVFGICMGHQLLGQALGGSTFKMKFGHHGGNHPVRHLQTGRVEISSQVYLTFLTMRHTICRCCFGNEGFYNCASVLENLL